MAAPGNTLHLPASRRTPSPVSMRAGSPAAKPSTALRPTPGAPVHAKTRRHPSDRLRTRWLRVPHAVVYWIRRVPGEDPPSFAASAAMPPPRRPGAGSHRGETGPPCDACGRWTWSPTLPGLQGLLSTSDPTSRGLHERDKHAGQRRLGEHRRRGRRSLGRARGIYTTEPSRNADTLGTRSASSRHAADGSPPTRRFAPVRRATAAQHLNRAASGAGPWRLGEAPGPG